MSKDGHESYGQKLVDRAHEGAYVVGHLDLQLVQAFGEDVQDPGQWGLVEVEVYRSVEDAVHHVTVQLFGGIPRVDLHAGSPQVNEE